MIVIETSIPEVKILEPKVFGDQRGYFMEVWNARLFSEIGLDLHFVQDNMSMSRAGVLRGLHYQIQNPQGKLVRVHRGSALDVAVDLRRSSATFGKSVSVELSGNNRRMLWVPPGFAHGFLSLEDGTEFMYKCTDFYAPKYERSLLWNDPKLAIVWPIDGLQLELSEKDRNGQPLDQAETFE